MLYLITIRMSPNHYWFLPTRYQSRNVATDDGLSEHRTTKDVPDRSIGRLPHLLKTKLCREEEEQVKDKEEVGGGEEEEGKRMKGGGGGGTFYSLLIRSDCSTLYPHVALFDCMGTLNRH